MRIIHNKIINIYLLSILLGTLVGIVGSSLKWIIDKLGHGFIIFYHWGHEFGLPLSVISAFTVMICVYIAFVITKRFAPEASGSGVQEIEGALLHQRPIYWRRLLPVKFIGGVLAISSKMVLGREGPTIQIGGNLGKMLGDIFNTNSERTDALIAAGAGAGLATAFNAPLAGVLFVIEEMRYGFNFTFTNFKMVGIACVCATIILNFLLGAHPAIPMHVSEMPSLSSLSLFVLLGLIVGFAGLLFNILMMRLLKQTDKWSSAQKKLYILGVSLLVGSLSYYYPQAVGGGYDIIEQALSLNPTLVFLLVLFFVRLLMTLLCYGTGVPGGIFAPMLALGTLLGVAYFKILEPYITFYSLDSGMFAVAGMGALFAAAVRAPITGIILVVEMTQNYLLILPLMVTCFVSTTVVQLANNPPIYTQLLKRVLRLRKLTT